VVCRLDHPRVGPLVEAAADSTATSSRDTVVLVILLPAPYLIFMSSVA
jgi:hypothetical protein